MMSRNGFLRGACPVVNAGSRRYQRFARFAVFLVSFLASGAIAAAETALLTDPAAVPGQELAYAMDFDGTLIVTGSPGHDVRTGLAHVFDCGEWPCAEPVPLSADGLSEGDLFGTAVAISGETVAIGAPGREAGAVHIYVRSGGVWASQALLAETGSVRFGGALALEGDRLIVGAEYEDDSAGAVYVYRRSGDSWIQEARLIAPDASPGDRFGASISLNADTLLVGAPFHAAAPGAFARGSAYVFLRSGDVWPNQAQLAAPDGIDGDLFAMSVAVHDDRAIIGAPLALGRRGTAHVFERFGTMWEHRAQLLASDGLAGDRFGWSVALTDEFAIAGAPYSIEGCGAGYLYRRSGETWFQTADASILLPLPGNLLGWTVAADGTDWAVGAPGYAGAFDHSGGVYWFGRGDSIFANGFEASRFTRGEEGCVLP